MRASPSTSSACFSSCPIAEDLLHGVRDSATPYKLKWLEARLSGLRQSELL